jgi:hypothetical protein
VEDTVVAKLVYDETNDELKTVGDDGDLKPHLSDLPANPIFEAFKGSIL